jgi:hypothetical protein
LDYARYYQQVTEAQMETSKLSAKMRHICNIESDVTNVFFIQFLKYAATNNLSYDEIDKVIDVVENYLARRIICNMPGNALTQVFCALHKDVLKSIAEYQSAGVPLTCSYPLGQAIFRILISRANYITIVLAVTFNFKSLIA